jgi:hypothetical protein
MTRADDNVGGGNGAMSANVAKLLTLMLQDQSQSGTHDGQFGRSESLAKAGAWNPGVEDLDSKPRMYMTRWPCRILRRHQLAKSALDRAVQGIERLFVGNVIPGEQSLNPFPGRRKRFTNFRHTLCGALILLEQKGWNPATEWVVGRVLSRAATWRTRNFGWLHSNAKSNETDLYSSLYAVQLLEASINNPEAPVGLADAAEPILDASLAFLAGEWDANGWAYETLTRQEVLPLAFIEVASILRQRRRALYDAIVDELRLYRNPGGGLQEEYLGLTDETVSEETCLARFAYASYLAIEEPTEVWRGFADAALRGDEGTLTSVEAAWLIDLELSNPRKSVGAASPS